MDKRDLLLEIGCEELPTRAVKFLAAQLADRLTGQLTICGVVGSILNGDGHNEGDIKYEVFATPRRLAVLIKDVRSQLPPRVVERVGPNYDKAFAADGKPTSAAMGFAKSCGVEVSALDVKDNRLYYKIEQPSQETIEILPDIVKQVISFLSIAKPMRWGDHPESFARPVHWIALLFGHQTVTINLFGIKSDNKSWGHRFHHPKPLAINTPAEYETILLKEGKVIANFDKRKEKIRQAVLDITPHGLVAELDPDLLEEVTSLVEWPVALIGRFNEEFLKVPQEVLITSMKTNQKYFPILNQKQQLQNTFILISNIESKNPQLIVQGNERVLNARLSDAAFFYQNDLAVSLQSRLPHLEHVTFQKQLGSLAHKTERMVNLSGQIAAELKEDINLAKEAAQLSKCDLLSEMVGEFPSLQGVMGYYYVKNDGLSEDCALAIQQHYAPRFSGDQLPATSTGHIIALADRLDTLVGIFGINQPPSGDKDPFGLRRAALGVLRILIEKSLPLDLEQLLKQAVQAYSTHLPNAEVIPQTFDFIMSRLKAWYLEKGISIEVFESVLASRPTKPLDFDQRIRAVQQFQKTPFAQDLAAANKRVTNILKKQAGDIWPTTLDVDLFEHEAERELAEQLTKQTQIAHQFYEKSDYTAALNQLSTLKEPIDHFFDKVMVMVEDKAKRNNRLALLVRLHHLFTQVADISLL